MKTFNFSNEQVRLLKQAINAYSEQCGFLYDEDSEDKISKMGKLYQLLSNPPDTLNTEEHDCSIYPICDY